MQLQPAAMTPRAPDAQGSQAVSQPSQFAQINAAPAMPRPAVPQSVQQMAPASPDGQGNGYSEAIGFGRDLPLALALSQVVPPEYSYAFGQNVDVGSTVSWQGGKPWNEVLNEMLAPSGMVSIIQDRQVTIVRKG